MLFKRSLGGKFISQNEEKKTQTTGNLQLTLSIYNRKKAASKREDGFIWKKNNK